MEPWHFWIGKWNIIWCSPLSSQEVSLTHCLAKYCQRQQKERENKQQVQIAVTGTWTSQHQSSDASLLLGTGAPRLVLQSRQTPAGFLCHCIDVCLCGWLVGALCRKSKKKLVRSQTACQGILVGVCIEVSQYEGFLLAAILESSRWNGTVSSLHGISRLPSSLTFLRQH